MGENERGKLSGSDRGNIEGGIVWDDQTMKKRGYGRVAYGYP